MKICIDAGHGGKDSGAVGVNGRLEKTDTLRMALELHAEMELRGHSVLLTRTGDTYPSLNERADMANEWGADVFVSCHRNAYDDPAANGGEVLYGRTASQTSIKLAELLNTNINRAAGFKNRGAKRQGATVLERTKMPAVTAEAGFITSTIDNDRFDKNFSAIIKAMADSLEAIFGRGTEAVPAPEPETGSPLDYVTTNGAVLWRNVGSPAEGTKVQLDAYPTQDEPGGAYARVKDASGDSYLVLWADIKKA